MKSNKRINHQSGFTLIELMIATAIFSTVLLMVSVMMIGVTRLYYKGINQARVQDAARQINEQISQTLQYSSKPFVKNPDGSGGSENTDGTVNLIKDGSADGTAVVKAYCMNNIRYTYVIGVQLGPGNRDEPQSPHVLWRDDSNVTGECKPIDLNNVDASKGTELALEGSRLEHFSIDHTKAPLYKIKVVLAYGDEDLLINRGENVRCKGSEGGQFCATASLTTSAIRRLTSN